MGIIVTDNLTRQNHLDEERQRSIEAYRLRRDARIAKKKAAMYECIARYYARRDARLAKRGLPPAYKSLPHIMEEYGNNSLTNGNTKARINVENNRDADKELTGGRWVTLKNGHKAYIDGEGNILAGQGQGGNINELGEVYEELEERYAAEAHKYSYKELTNERLAERIEQINSAPDKDSEAHDAERQKLLEDKLWLGDVPLAKNLGDVADDLLATGGFTYDLNTGEVKQVGFAVAIEGHETPVDISKIDAKQRRKVLIDYAEEKADILSEPGNHFGGWLNPGDGVLYLDISKVTNDIKEARKNANDADQQAIYDFQTMDTITIIEGAAEERTKQGGN